MSVENDSAPSATNDIVFEFVTTGPLRAEFDSPCVRLRPQADLTQPIVLATLALPGCPPRVLTYRPDKQDVKFG